jgi:ABC-2 type transport system ATP-binding protein
MGDAIAITDLHRRFGQTLALFGLDLHIPAGCVYGLMGRNGAGKSTALRILMGLVRPDRGQALVLGYDLSQATTAQRAQVAYVAQGQRLPGWMTADQLDAYCACFTARWDRDYLRELCRRWAIPRTVPVSSLSGGTQRKLSLVLGLAARAQVLLLDEPAAGLDPVARRELLDALVEVLSDGRGATVVICTHLVADLERLAERVGVIDGGRLALEGRLDDWQTRISRVQIVYPDAATPSTTLLPRIIRSQREGMVQTVIADGVEEAILDALRAQPGVRVVRSAVSLEDVVIAVLGPSIGTPSLSLHTATALVET